VDFKANLAFTANQYGKDIILTETGYYWKPSRYFREMPGPFPETPEGQRQWLDEMNRIVMDTPGGHGKGVFWWEPAATGGLVARGYFDDDGNALPIFEAFHKFTRPEHRTDNQ
jgi:arabinogalactan endo-1,4-beta-galactosidase